MENIAIPTWIWAAALVAFSVTAMLTDLRSRRIPNVLTVPFFAAGLVYQGVVNGWAGLGHAGLAFLIGFGTLYLLWLVGAGGGGDVKLMGAMSVWLGPTLTFVVLAGSVGLTFVWAVGIAAYSLFGRGLDKTRNRYVWKASQRNDKYASGKQKRRIIAYAVPVGCAVWVVVALHLLKEIPS
ncbi:MAG: A24 family peptidase [Planctomycetales bacterium]